MKPKKYRKPHRYKGKLKYKWWKDTHEVKHGRLRKQVVHRWDLVLMGEPDCFAYIVRYDSPVYGIYRSVWCWKLTMPRGATADTDYHGWSHSAHGAKLQVEAAITEHWR